MIQKQNTTARTGMEIAVIGMSGRFPGAKNLHEYWDNLKNGVESIVFFSHEELARAGLDEEILKNPNYIRARGYLQDIELFDASFFGYSPQEAELMNPQTRLFHESAWEVLEDAGYNPGTYNDRIGLYAGASPNFNWEARLHLSGKSAEYGSFASSQFIDKEFLCSRVSYNLNLKGGTSFVQTACSTSLVSIHHACRALLTGESEMVLAGGVSLSSSSLHGYLYQEGMISSPDGHCRTFSDKSRGTVGGSGAGVVLLKRLKSALHDRDHIYALIKGTAINNDGNRKMGFTAPSVEAQAEVILTAQRMARVEPETITYIEAHGTGTNLGDPVEIEALKLAFNTDKRNYCGIGSVKTNFGHLDAASGVAGFIKTVLALKFRLIPPSLHFETSNSAIDFKNSPFYVNNMLKKWESNGYPLRAGVSSLGIGGTNAHMVLEEFTDHYEKKTNTTEQENPKLILLSARTPSALEKMTENLARHFKENPSINLADAAYTLQVGRKVFSQRRMSVNSTIEETIAALTSNPSQRLHTYNWKPGEKEREVVFMFPGQGSQYVNMGLDLYRTESIFREEIDRCIEILKSILPYNLKEILYPIQSVSTASPTNPTNNKKPLDINQTEITQPLLFAFEYALAKLLLKWGIVPYAMIGHSIGEYVAALISGILSLEEGLKLASIRGQLMQQMPPGSMVSVSIPEQQLIPLLNPELSLAAVNAPSHCVVSGPLHAITAFENEIQKQGYDCRKLHVSHAYHSSMMEPILERFKTEVARVTLNKPKIPYISGLSGNWITPEEVTDPNYWAKHLRETVRFSQGVEKLLNKANCLFLEVGPGNVLSSLVRRHNQNQNVPLTIHLIKHPQENVSDNHFLLNKIGELWLHWKNIDWFEFSQQHERRRVPLPTYPFERQRYSSEDSTRQLTSQLLARKALLKKKDISEWFYIPIWKQSPLEFFKDCNNESTSQLKWLIFLDDHDIGTRLKERLFQNKQKVIVVKSGSEFTRINDFDYAIHPGKADHYTSLFTSIIHEGNIPDIILHLWNVTGRGNRDNSFETLKNDQDHGYFSLLYMAQAIGNLNVNQEIKIMVVTDNLQDVTGDEELCPGKASVLGPARVVPQEYPNISFRCIDINCPNSGNWQDAEFIDKLHREFQASSSDTTIAYRGTHRWAQIYEPISERITQKDHKNGSNLKEKGVYLITGGLGRIGMVLAEYLAAAVKARLILTGRSDFPVREEWQQWLSTHKNDSISQKIKKILELEKLGAEVLVIKADVADQTQMQQVVHQAEKTFGPINGVAHVAGIIGEKTIQTVSRTDQSQSREQFYPKIEGVLVLEDILKDKSLDFCLLFSSLASILGGLGFTAYSAANIFMDYFARCRNRVSSHYWTSINWDGWNFKSKEEGSITGKKSTVDFSITTEEASKAFEHIFSWNNLSQIIVSTGDLQTRINQWVTFTTKDEEFKPRMEDHSPRHGREQISTSYVPPSNALQQNIIDIWEKFFGITPIGIIDSFFDLGGDSLTAITMAGQLHKRLNTVIPLAEFFNRPTVMELTEYIKEAGKNTYSSINPTEEKEYYVLSSAQRRLFTLHQMRRDSIAYNMPTLLQIGGMLDRDRLEKTFKKLIERHENFRVSFLVIGGKPMQRINQKVEFKIEMSNIDTENTAETLDLIIQRFVQPFDLMKTPLVRVGLIKIEEEKYILMIDMHHIISDGVSQAILVSDFMSLYQERKLPPLKLQYKDFSEWEEKQLHADRFIKQEKYWLSKIGGDIPVLDISTDFPRPPVQRFEGHTIKSEIEEMLAEKLKALTEKQGVTLYMLLLSIFTILLSKYTNQNDIIIGSPVAGRSHTDLEPIVGMFVNVLLMRNIIDPKKSFEEFLEEVRSNTLQAFDNQDYSIDYLSGLLDLKRDASRNPLYEVIFAMMNVEIQKFTIPGLELKLYQYFSEAIKTDLRLAVLEENDKIILTLTYSTALFVRKTAEDILSHYIEIIKQVLSDSNIKIEDIKISHHFVPLMYNAFKEDNDEFNF